MRTIKVVAGLAAGSALLLVAACGESEKPMGGKWAENPPWKPCEATECPTDTSTGD